MSVEADHTHPLGAGQLPGTVQSGDEIFGGLEGREKGEYDGYFVRHTASSLPPPVFAGAGFAGIQAVFCDTCEYLLWSLVGL